MSNKIVQLVVQHCCIASCRANVARIATLSIVAQLWIRSSFYFLQQRKVVAHWVVIQATFTLQLAMQQCCAKSCEILLLVLLHLKIHTYLILFLRLRESQPRESQRGRGLGPKLAFKSGGSSSLRWGTTTQEAHAIIMWSMYGLLM